MPDASAAIAALGAPSGEGNMLDMAAKAAQINSLGLANQQNSQMLRARMAMGPIMQQSVDENGNPDYNKAAIAMAKNPDTAFMAPDFLDKLVSRQLTQTGVFREQFNLEMERQGAISQRMASLLASGRPVTRATMLAEARDAHANGIISDQDMQGFTQRVLTTPEGEATSALARQIGGNSKTAHDTMRLTMPTIEERMKRLETIGPGGQPGSIPALQAAGVGGGGGAPAPGAPAAGGGASAGGAPSTFMPSGLPPARAEQLKQFTAQGQKEAEAARDSEQLLPVLTEMEGALKQFQPGAGASMKQQLQKFAQAIGVKKETFNPILANTDVNSPPGDSLAASQLFSKYALELATNRMRELLKGGGRFTNIEFQSFLKALPTMDMDPHAIDEMLKFVKRRINTQIAYGNDYNYAIENNEAPSEFYGKWAKATAEMDRRRRQELGVTNGR
jgi:hypothetical protein